MDTVKLMELAGLLARTAGEMQTAGAALYGSTEYDMLSKHLTARGSVVLQACAELVQEVKRGEEDERAARTIPTAPTDPRCVPPYGGFPE